MNWVGGTVIFLLIWWTAVFAVLPWGLKRDERGIPQDAQIKRKLVVTTVLSIVIWLVVYAMIESNVISFHDLSETMMKKDYGS